MASLADLDSRSAALSNPLPSQFVREGSGSDKIAQRDRSFPTLVHPINHSLPALKARGSFQQYSHATSPVLPSGEDNTLETGGNAGRWLTEDRGCLSL